MCKDREIQSLLYDIMNADNMAVLKSTLMSIPTHTHTLYI